jgi:hypothetical protein
MLRRWSLAVIAGVIVCGVLGGFVEERGRAPTLINFEWPTLGSWGWELSRLKAENGFALYPESINIPNKPKDKEALLSRDCCLKFFRSEGLVIEEGAVRLLATVNSSWVRARTFNIPLGRPLARRDGQISLDLSKGGYYNIASPYGVKSRSLPLIANFYLNLSLSRFAVQTEPLQLNLDISPKLGARGFSSFPECQDEQHGSNDAEQHRPEGILGRIAGRIRSLPLGAKVGIAIVLAAIAGRIVFSGFLQVDYRRTNRLNGLGKITFGLLLFGLLIGFWWLASPN